MAVSLQQALVDEATKDMLVGRLNKEEGRSHRSEGVINKLMDETFTNRHSRITNDRPQVKNVIEKFPSLKDDQCVSSPKLIYALYTLIVHYLVITLCTVAYCPVTKTEC